MHVHRALHSELPASTCKVQSVCAASGGWLAYCIAPQHHRTVTASCRFLTAVRYTNTWNLLSQGRDNLPGWYRQQYNTRSTFERWLSLMLVTGSAVEANAGGRSHKRQHIADGFCLPSNILPKLRNLTNRLQVQDTTEL